MPLLPPIEQTHSSCSGPSDGAGEVGCVGGGEVRSGHLAFEVSDNTAECAMFIEWSRSERCAVDFYHLLFY